MKTKLGTKLGMILFILGWITMDSGWLILPLTLAGLGIWLMRGVINVNVD